jgi:hypothetical protein
MLQELKVPLPEIKTELNETLLPTIEVIAPSIQFVVLFATRIRVPTPQPKGPTF